MGVFQHTQLRGSAVADEFGASGLSCGLQLAPGQTRLDEAARCVAEFGACRRVSLRHGSRRFEGGLARATRRRVRTVMISCSSQPPNTALEPTGTPLSFGGGFGQFWSRGCIRPSRSGACGSA